MSDDDWARGLGKCLAHDCEIGGAGHGSACDGAFEKAAARKSPCHDQILRWSAKAIGTIQDNGARFRAGS